MREAAIPVRQPLRGHAGERRQNADHQRHRDHNLDQREAGFAAPIVPAPVHGGGLRRSRTVAMLSVVPRAVRTLIVSITGSQGLAMPAALTKGATSMRQRRPAVSPAIVPGFRAVRSVSASSARTVSISAKCSSSAWLPRTVAPTSAPIDVSITAITASATTTSIKVKPALAAGASERVEPDNLDASGEPIDADFVAGAEPAERDHAAAGHAGSKEHDGVARLALIAAGGERRVEAHVARQQDASVAGTRA